MPVRFLSNGVVEVDTLSEAIAWETRKSKTLKSVGRPRKLKPNPVDANPWERFCIDIRAGNCTRMRKILGIVRGRGQAGIDLHELSSSVGDSNALNTALPYKDFCDKISATSIGCCSNIGPITYRYSYL